VKLFFDLSSRIKLRVTGADCERFLQGQLTNDIRKATKTRTIEAFVLNAKGKLNAHLFIAGEGGAFLIDAASELRDSLLPRLERYIIADDVKIEDVSDRFAIFHLLGQTAPNFPGEFEVRLANRFAEPGHDIWSAVERRDELVRELSRQFTFCDADRAEIFRIERGIPRWGRELNEEIIPVEANLETQTIDYDKGCYVGQEVISRMKMSGQSNKRLCGLIGAKLEAGMRLIANTPEAKDVGWITSVAESDLLKKRIALGFVKRGFNLTGTNLRAIAPPNPERVVEAEIVDLPFLGPSDLRP
jgi:folate-binding protein YgfZ